MQVFAAFTSAISNAEVRFELVAHGNGFALRNVETGTVELGTFTDKTNKFESLELFRRIYREFSPSFELV